LGLARIGGLVQWMSKVEARTMNQKTSDQKISDPKDLDLKVWLARSPIVAILRGVTPPEVEAIVEVLAESGILVVEVPLNSPDPFASIERVARRFGEKMLVGAGTVLG